MFSAVQGRYKKSYKGDTEKTAGNPEKFKALVNSKDPHIYVVILDS